MPLTSRFVKATAVLAIMSSFPLYGEAVGVDKAREAAATQALMINERLAENRCLDSGYEPTSDDSQELYDASGETLLAYVFDLTPQGFVVVTADNSLVPVIAYSEQGYFAWDEGNPLLDVLRGDLGRQKDALLKGTYPARELEKNHEDWEAFVTGEAALLDPGESWPPAGQTESGGWVESAWTQSSPYNDSCPMDPVTEVRSLAGCPAVTVGQIVNFWQYPDSVIFTDDDSYVSDYNGRTIPIDAPAASIPWIDYNQGDPSDGVCADLVYACGVATQSVYTSEMSGVFTNSWCAHAFLEHFDYTSADFREGDGGNFYEVMEQNMKDSMPAIIVIVGEIGGHTLVCDGYREPTDGGEPQWHLNFGWGTYQPRYLPLCWYVIPDSLPYGLTTLHEAIVNIEAPRRPEKAAVKERFQEKLTVSCSSRPNPFAETTVIEYHLPQGGQVSVGIWDATGSCVKKLVNSVQTQGSYSLEWDGRDDRNRILASGVYFARINVDGIKASQRLVILR